MEQYTLADATFLNTLKNSLRAVTKMLDTTQKVYPDSIEASQVKHEMAVLFSELAIHGLLPASVNNSSDITHVSAITSKEATEVVPQNPKPYHIELRLNTGVQEILLEDDIQVSTEQEAEDQYCELKGSNSSVSLRKGSLEGIEKVRMRERRNNKTGWDVAST